MKKILVGILVLAILAGCSAPAGTVATAEPAQGGASPGSAAGQPAALDSSDILEIGERFFVTQMHQILLNRERYLGRTIRYEGMFFTMNWEGEYYHFVIRYTNHCCGGDGMIGFDVELGDIEPFPDNTWVEVTGVLGEFALSEWYSMPIVYATSIVEMPQRGREFVVN